MKFATVVYDNQSHVVYVDDKNGRVLLLAEAARKIEDVELGLPNNLADCIKLGETFIEAVQKIVDWSETNTEGLYADMHEVIFQAPIPRPAKNIFCVGKNYAEHALELGSADDIPEHVMLFSKTPTTVIGDGAEIPSHADLTKELDYEGELAVIIGKQGKGINREEALDYVFGYTVLNDITARDIQAKHKQFLLGKSLDGSCPMGPYIVHKSLVENPGHLDIVTKVNGEVRQQSNTQHFIFPVEEVIEVISKGMTLEPGDIIATGTPAGVGKGFKPPKYLKQGDTVEITVQGVGTLKNTVGE
ncbi:fumarylacetoacetate hydrolase family protein [Peribacillus sp. SCS-155]|uniref:fumarylacetoacetate hydrolase family protein n=1 Tax=Peribacillus sedimenti TaxID=3115297 RepID=UPI003905B97B